MRAETVAVVVAAFYDLRQDCPGDMFMGLFGPRLGVRLGEADRVELGAIEGSDPFGPPDRPMREYVSLPAAWRDQPTLAEPWIRKGLAHTAAMPAKKPKKPKKAT